MEAYNASFAPEGFRLSNPGSCCYLNAFLQALAACTSVTKAALNSEPYLSKTLTGKAFYEFIKGVAGHAVVGASRKLPRVEMLRMSTRVLAALKVDLAVRRPNVRFGTRQEDVQEALVLLLEMMGPPSAGELNRIQAAVGPADVERLEQQPVSVVAAEVGKRLANGAYMVGLLHMHPRGQASASEENPIARLFYHRFMCDVHCAICKNVVSSETDYAITFQLFHYDYQKSSPKTPVDFVKLVRRHVERLEDYVCEICKKKVDAFRVYRLKMIPEVLACMFKYDLKRKRYFPSRLAFDAKDGGSLRYRQVAQVEHYGSLLGGHYVAMALRADDRVLCFDDAAQPVSSYFGPTSQTFMVFYHAEGLPDHAAVADAEVERLMMETAVQASAATATTLPPAPGPPSAAEPADGTDVD